MFKRKKDGDKADTAAASKSDQTDSPLVQRAAPEATTGPWELADLSDEGRELPRLDLGAIQVPIPETLELRVELDEEGNVGGAVVADGHSTLQLNAFAASRRGGLWDEVRTEIAQALADQGVTAQEADGVLGRELQARIPTGDAKGTTTSARFVGSDGPRWFLRGLLSGPAATDAAQAAPFEEVFRGVVVVRGNEAMAPRDALALRLPVEAQAQAQMARGEQRPTGYDDLDPFKRGPEITEIQ